VCFVEVGQKFPEVIFYLVLLDARACRNLALVVERFTESQLHLPNHKYKRQ
jgi:hypothetical protein